MRYSKANGVGAGRQWQAPKTGRDSLWIACCVRVSGNKLDTVHRAAR